jgi:hypothetical protein
VLLSTAAGCAHVFAGACSKNSLLSTMSSTAFKGRVPLLRLVSPDIADQALLNCLGKAAAAQHQQRPKCDSSTAVAEPHTARSSPPTASGSAGLPYPCSQSQEQLALKDAERLLLQELQRMNAEMYPDLFPDVRAADDNNNHPAADGHDGFYGTSAPSTPIVHREADVLEASPEFKVFKQLAGDDGDDPRFNSGTQVIHWAGSNKALKQSPKQLPFQVKRAAARSPFADLAAAAQQAENVAGSAAHARAPAAGGRVQRKLCRAKRAVLQTTPALQQGQLQQPAAGGLLASVTSQPGVPGPRSHDYSIIAKVLAAAAASCSASTAATSATAIAAAAFAAAAGAATAAAAHASTAGTTSTHSIGISAGCAARTTLGKRWRRDWDQQQSGGSVPASTADNKAASLDHVVAGICAAAARAGAISTPASASGSRCGSALRHDGCGSVESEVCSPAKKRVKFRDSVPGSSLQEFRLFLKHESPRKVS